MWLLYIWDKIRKWPRLICIGKAHYKLICGLQWIVWWGMPNSTGRYAPLIAFLIILSLLLPCKRISHYQQLLTRHPSVRVVKIIFFADVSAYSCVYMQSWFLSAFCKQFAHIFSGILHCLGAIWDNSEGCLMMTNVLLVKYHWSNGAVNTRSQKGFIATSSIPVMTMTMKSNLLPWYTASVICKCRLYMI